MEAFRYTSSKKMIAQQISQNFQEVLHYVIKKGCAKGRPEVFQKNWSK